LRIEARYETVLQFKQALLGGQAVSVQAVSLSASFTSLPTVLGSGSSASQRLASQPISQLTASQGVARPSVPWLWIGAGVVGVLGVVSLLLIIMGLVLSRGETAVVSLPTVTPKPAATWTATFTPEPAVTWTATPAPQIIADSATDTPIPPTSTPKPTETRIPPTETPIPPTETPIPPTDTPEPPTSTPKPKPPTQNSNSGMVRIPAGAFIMGSTQAQVDAAFEACQKAHNNGCDKKWYEAEMPQHTVNLGEYSIDEYEVVNGQYANCVTAGKCTVPHETKSWTRDNYYNNPEFANYPVIYVDWTQAKNYCEFVGKRLSTEAEWEKAARGTDGRIYPWGNNGPNETLLNYNGKVGDTTKVGSYPSGASPFGGLDMAGNVWEWTSSDYKAYPYIANDTHEELLSNSNKVIRGGSFDYDDIGTRSARRHANDPTATNNNLGFRCAQ